MNGDGGSAVVPEKVEQLTSSLDHLISSRLRAQVFQGPREVGVGRVHAWSGVGLLTATCTWPLTTSPETQLVQ